MRDGRKQKQLNVPVASSSGTPCCEKGVRGWSHLIFPGPVGPQSAISAQGRGTELPESPPKFYNFTLLRPKIDKGRFVDWTSHLQVMLILGRMHLAARAKDLQALTRRRLALDSILRVDLWKAKPRGTPDDTSQGSEIAAGVVNAVKILLSLPSVALANHVTRSRDADRRVRNILPKQKIFICRAF